MVNIFYLKCQLEHYTRRRNDNITICALKKKELMELKRVQEILLPKVCESLENEITDCQKCLETMEKDLIFFENEIPLLEIVIKELESNIKQL